MKNEKTSKRVAKIAGRILETLKTFKTIPNTEKVIAGDVQIGTVGEIKALAASALTQAADKKTTKR